MYNHSDTVYDGCYDRKKIKTWKGAPELKCVEGEGQGWLPSGDAHGTAPELNLKERIIGEIWKYTSQVSRVA